MIFKKNMAISTGPALVLIILYSGLHNKRLISTASLTAGNVSPLIIFTCTTLVNYEAPEHLIVHLLLLSMPLHGGYGMPQTNSDGRPSYEIVFTPS